MGFLVRPFASGHSALHRVSGYLKAVVHAKLCRIRRELKLGWIRFHQSDEVWIASSLREDNRSA
jgi:hypothetical protein